MSDAGSVLKLRPALAHDADVLLIWRNDPTTRAMSQNSTPVTRETHMNWFQNALSNDVHLIFIAEQNSDPVGMVRFDVAHDGDTAEVSINIAPNARNKKLATPLLHLASSEIIKRMPAITRLMARIKTDNPRSQRAFERAGYVKVRENDGYNFYHVTP